MAVVGYEFAHGRHRSDDSLRLMPNDVDVVIIGAGLMGAASAWSVAGTGRSVVVLEQFGAVHNRGSSHGSARIVRRAYSDGLYVSLTGRAFELWRDLEIESGTQLLRMLGGLDFGVRRGVPEIARLLAEAGVEHEVMGSAEAEGRWPGMRFEGEVIYHPQAGTVDTQSAIGSFLAMAGARGATARAGVGATTVVPAEDHAVVTLSDGSSLRAQTVVVAAGAWVEPLIGHLVPLPPLRITQQQIFHFPRLDPTASPWPSVITEGERALYHLAGGRDGGPDDDRKIGEHDAGNETTAAARDGVVDPESRRRVISYVERWLPGLDPTPRGEATCLYTETPSEDFILDRVGPLVVCSPCSGHGAKFAPLIGEMVAGLVTRRAEVPDRFRLSSHALGRTGAVSL
jgi:monomeric sarcosine oxidase